MRPSKRGMSTSTRVALTRLSAILLILVVSFFIGSGIYYAISQPATTPSPPPVPAASDQLSIQNVSISSITETSAVISWETDKPATGQVVVCDHEGVCTSTELQETPIANHSITLTGLQPNTTYHYTVIVQDASGNETSTEGELTTLAPSDTTPPVISGVSVSNISDSGATITWITDEPTTCQVSYGASNDYGLSVSSGTELATSHSAVLTTLEPDTTYHFTIISKDASGNETTLAQDQTFKTQPAIPVGYQVGYRAPDFTLKDIDGNDVALSDFRGKIVMVNFWATWCEPCLNEMPHIQAVRDNWSSDELAILAIHVKHGIANTQSWMEDKDYTVRVLLDSTGTAGDAYNVNTGIPKTFFLDAKGIIREVRNTAFSSQSQIEAILDSIRAM